MTCPQNNKHHFNYITHLEKYKSANYKQMGILTIPYLYIQLKKPSGLRKDYGLL